MTAVPDRPRTLPVLRPGHAFAAAGLVFGAIYLAAGAPTPLLVVFERRWGFPPSMLTLAFAGYAFGLLAALLVVGSLSDHIGRRPVLVGALLVEVVAMVMFAVAPGIGWVIAARVVQGAATGAASSAFTAALVELAPPRRKAFAAVLGGAAPMGGLGLGALLSGVAAQLSDHANLLVFGVLAVVMVAGAVAALFSAETVARQAGAVRSLRPQVSVPGAARVEFAAVVPVLLASWALAGLYIGLTPVIVPTVFHLGGGLVTGFVAFTAPAAAAVAALALRPLDGRHALLLGGAGVAVGTVLDLVAVRSGLLPVFVLGGAVGGAGFGAAFSGALRKITPLAAAHQRAGVVAAVLLVSYLSFGVPALAAGELVRPAGLQSTVLGYAVFVLLACAAGLTAQLRLSRAPRPVVAAHIS